MSPLERAAISAMLVYAWGIVGATALFFGVLRLYDAGWHWVPDALGAAAICWLAILTVSVCRARR